MKDSVAAGLAIKAQQGDMQAFEQLYIEFSPLIYSILLEITHDTYEAEDLTQDCFVSALKNIHTLKEPAKIKKWLTAIAANHGKDYLKKKKPALLSAEHEYIFDIQEEKNEALLPEENAILDERGEEIREIVNSVSEDKRLCLVLFYQHEMSITEISKELGISESAVKSRLFRAREDIREEVEKRNKKGMPLFGIAPLPLILFALQKSSQVAEASFAGSAAQTAAFAGITAASQAGIAASTTAATAASATASAASTTATAATGIGAKVAAMSVAQKVVAGVAAASIVTGSAVGTTVVVKNKIETNEETTTAYIEEYTTAPDYGFENETVFVPAAAETESLTSELSTNRNSVSAAKKTTTAAQTKETVKTTVADKTTSKANTTTQKQTTTKVTTTQLQTTATTKVTATEKATTTKAATTKVTTTRAVTTTTTTKATTTTTQASSPATVTVTVWGETSSTTKTLYFEAGETITATEIENRLSDEYGIEAIADDINITAEAGGSYTATAYE